jgi:hypothetical protein
MEAIWTCAVATLLGLWLGASVIHQLSPAWWQRLARRDSLSLLPGWSFFAPNPGCEDTHVVYRDQCDGRWSEWRALTAPPTGTRWRWFWQPQRYTRKAAADLANGLRRSAGRYRDAPRASLLSNAYVALLQWVSSQPADLGVSHRQFAILTSSGFDRQQELAMLFLSEAHSLDP